MTKKQSTKKALLLSALSIVLCLSMLIGTTFAWFTDSVTSGSNIIKSGNLDVEMYWADGTKAVPATEAGWTDASTGAIFNYELWEPGYVEVRHIKIANVGSLALKYKVQIVANGEVSDLANVIDVYYVDPAVQVANRAALVNAPKIGTLATVLADLGSTGSGTLEADRADTITIALKMQETAGNEYQNMAIGSDFSIRLLATQLASEEDSFGSDYDKDAWHPEMTVATADELQAALTSAEPGTEIVITNDIDLTESIVIPAPAASTYSLRANSGVVLNLNGKSIKGTVGRDADNNRIHVLVNNGNLTINGGTITSAGVNGGSAIYNAAGATLTINGTTVNGAPFGSDTSAWPSYAINNYGKMTVNDAVVKSYHGGIATGGDGVSVVNNAKVDVGQGTTTKQTSWALYNTDNGQLTVNGGVFENTKNEYNKVYGGGYVCPTSTKATVINGGVFNKTEGDGNGTGIYYNPTNLVINGGTFDTNPSAYVSEGCLVINNGDGTYSVYANNADAVMSLKDGAVLDLGGVEFAGTVTAEGDLTIKGDAKIKALKAVNGGTITVEEGKTLTMNNFSFGSKSTAGSEYEIKGGKIVASYGFFQHGTYALHADFETGYMYYSYGSDITVYGTFHSKGSGDGLDYVRGKLTIANGGKSIHDKSLWIGQPASWGAMNATLIVEEGGYVQANSISVYEGSVAYNRPDNVGVDGVGIKYNSISGTITVE